MKDIYKELMERSFYDAVNIVDTINQITEEEFDGRYKIPDEAIPQIAIGLYRSRIVKPEVLNIDDSDVRSFR